MKLSSLELSEGTRVNTIDSSDKIEDSDIKPDLDPDSDPEPEPDAYQIGP